MTTRAQGSAAAIGLADLPLRPELVGEEPYGAPQLDVPVLLNVNENPYAPSDRVRAEIATAAAEAATVMNRYPDREARALRSRLARYLGHGLTADNIWAANGSNEVMTHLLQAFAGPDRSLLTFGPTYSMYPEYARNTHTRFVVEPRADDFTLDPDRVVAAVTRHQPDVVVVTTPNNPTGTVTGLDTIRTLLDVAPGIVVIDEAYQEFVTPGLPTALELLGDYPRLVVSRTMSKAFAFAGGRLGYLAAAPAIVDACRIVRLPYHLSGITQAVASVALDNAPEMMAHVAELRAARDDLVDWLREQGLPVVPTQANFVLFGAFADRHEVWSQLLADGVLIRETGPAGMLRVSVGTPAEMAAFKAALLRVLANEEMSR
ncbi:histidinol-phosphate transaminase [Granulicoccus sp. GXG6511]|uniref:histidinol-phosphate transaminase n=1 Tax=Granulicoccus sp. GXG6511 TaxID=3381351 RepID=UPI003D7C7094